MNRLLLVLLLVFSVESVAVAQRRVPKKPGEKGSVILQAGQKIGKVGFYRSQNFVVTTDLSEEKTEELMGRLETMLGLISTYWGKALTSPIEMYVMDNASDWPPQLQAKFPPKAFELSRAGGGITIGNSAGASFVYSSTRSALHEAVHSYCQKSFGRTGPVWYSEGMAEMGQYWRKGDASVNIIEPGVLRYLQGAEIKSLNEIVNGQEVTGDSWQNYSWRWALCHLLATNTNYADRFRPLGMAMLTQKPVSFESVYGAMAKEISFEYIFFLEHLENGFRADLCSWDWKSKFYAATPGRIRKSEIAAAGGWQPGKLTIEAGQEYDFSASGTWQLSEKGEKLTAEGTTTEAAIERTSASSVRTGKLVGILFDDYKLSEPFELGAYGTFKATSSGQLYLRCEDHWGEIGDNSGTISVQVRLHDAERPLPKPETEESPGSITAETTETTPTEEPAEDARKAASKVRLGKLLLKRNAEKAKEYLQEAVELAPNSPAGKEAAKLLKKL